MLIYTRIRVKHTVHFGHANLAQKRAMERKPHERKSTGQRRSGSPSWQAKKNAFKKDDSKGKNRGPQKLGNVLAELMAQRGYAQLGANEECVEAWKSVVGKLDKFTRATEVKRGVLQVIVSNSVVMQELTFRKAELLAAIIKSLPNYNIKDLRFRIGSI